jgi:bacteriocin biosynthesis cyclodehydratase domain-containing protein
MNLQEIPGRVRFAFPFAILTGPSLVRLVAGEEFRYTLRSPSLEQWLPAFLSNFQMDVEWRGLMKQLPSEHNQQALEIIARLYGERVLLESNGEHGPIPTPIRFVVEGEGQLCKRVQMAERTSLNVRPSSAEVAVLCQDNLDYAAALDFNQRRRKSNALGWLWLTSGPMGRGFVSPVFRPDAGPCLACLIRNFQRLSPFPEIYDHLIEHSRAAKEIPSLPFPAPALDILASLARWKIEQSTNPEPSSAIYRLHVVEIKGMDCTTHRVFRDPYCPQCAQP